MFRTAGCSSVVTCSRPTAPCPCPSSAACVGRSGSLSASGGAAPVEAGSRSRHEARAVRRSEQGILAASGRCRWSVYRSKLSRQSARRQRHAVDLSSFLQSVRAVSGRQCRRAMDRRGAQHGEERACVHVHVEVRVCVGWSDRDVMMRARTGGDLQNGLGLGNPAARDQPAWGLWQDRPEQQQQA